MGKRSSTRALLGALAWCAALGASVAACSATEHVGSGQSSGTGSGSGGTGGSGGSGGAPGGGGAGGGGGGGGGGPPGDRRGRCRRRPSCGGCRRLLWQPGPQGHPRPAEPLLRLRRLGQ